LWRTFSKWRI